MLRPLILKPQRIIVIGGSTGALPALQPLVAALPHDLPAVLLVVLHIGPHRSVLPELLARWGALAASHAVDGDALRAGQILVAPPDRHLLVSGGHVRLQRGAKEHHTRPAIDPLFRSAALAFGPRAVGVVLSGLLDDGTAGVQAVKACGGIAVVQDPADAEEASMPRSAIRHARVDHVVKAAAMGRLLADLVTRPLEVPTMAERPAAVDHEVALMLGEGDPVDHLRHIGTPSMFSCPDCHGGLWQVNGADPPRYRCHTGHGFSARSLLHAMAVSADEALWNALRAVQECRELQREFGGAADPTTEAVVAQLGRDIEALRAMLRRGVPEALGAEA